MMKLKKAVALGAGAAAISAAAAYFLAWKAGSKRLVTAPRKTKKKAVAKKSHKAKVTVPQKWEEQESVTE